MDNSTVTPQIAFLNHTADTFSVVFPFMTASGHGVEHLIGYDLGCPIVDWTGLDERQELLLVKILRKYITPAGVINLPRLLVRLTQIGCKVSRKETK